MTPETYRHLLSVARRHAAGPSAGDLLHDALIVAACQDVDLDADSGQRWLGGVLRNLARHQARTDGRRTRREAASAPTDAPEPDDRMTDAHRPAERWETIPPASRRVVALALHGLGKDEICAALGLSDTAFRQRLTTARRALGPLPADLQREAIALAYDRRTQRGDDLALGLVRRALLRSLRSTDAVGTHDPDGHLMVVGRSA